MEKRNRSVHLVLIIILIISFFPGTVVFSQDGGNDSPAYQQATRLLSGMSPEEKVGQLFLITFDGTDIAPDSEIAQLISEYHIGGVVLKQSNGNIPNASVETSLKGLIEGLQSAAYEGAMPQAEDAEIADIGTYIPLFIGVTQAGGSYPYDQILSNITSLPSQMAVGATWDTSVAIDVGELMGNELESLGFNLLIGPSLDIPDYIYSETEKSLGARTFGGDPFWVSEMGAAYITGLHRGSGNRLAVISSYFPGGGATDRVPDVEVSTVRKSLEQLELIELAPFFKVTDINQTAAAAITDGLLTSHIRYQGLQGNIRATTKPISFDQNAINLLMGLEPLNTWRSTGGVLVSDDLGSDAVEKFFNPEGQYIDARQVVKNAFLAGNDVLYMDRLISTGDANRFVTYRSSIELFVQKYKEDAAFAQRIDESVLRILTLKYDLYNEFNLDRVLANKNVYPAQIDVGDIPFQTAQQAATLINPSQNQLNEFISDPPQFGERIIIFSDSETIVPCDGCDAVDTFPVNGLQKAIIGLYGPDASGQINPNHIVSYTFNDLRDFVVNPINRPEIEENLAEAKWAIFALREINEDNGTSYALHDLISSYPAKLRDKHVIVFSFDSPNYFDATDISAFSAYYALYSKTPSFIDVAARIIFQEFTPSGASPVSVPGTGYDLIEQMTPDPFQLISLSVDEQAVVASQSEDNGEPAATEEEPEFKLGDTIPVMTGVILDHNGNQVPDGTIVTFEMTEQGDGVSIQQIRSETRAGIARASFQLVSTGMHEIRVTSEPANSSEILVLDITEEQAIVSAFVPTPIPVQTETPEAEEQPLEESPASQEVNNAFSEWFVATLLAWFFAIVSFFMLRDYFIFENGLKITSGGVIGGLIVVVWMMFDFPGVNPRYGMNGYIRLSMVVFLGVMLGELITWLILRLLKQILVEE